ncbi:hypothetical protein HHK36_011441 [Tetracentron sinense]|uniref:F-box protein n=1 Tax=Tetracentron sinense TaxID=13715 RepID=A0A835DKF2_TETSI|nr:hypothetical protein HHK36_011441 [Tetracentron sinense]
MQMICSLRSTTTAGDEGGATTISAVNSDVLQTHILTRLDGPTLASASCASSQLHSLSTQENLWTDICRATWPSMDNPRMRHLISSFPNGPRSFFSDSFPLLLSPPDHPHHYHRPSPTPELIFAVDIRYKNALIFSKTHETETLSGWFRCSPFRIDLLDPKDVVPTPIRYPDGEESCRSLSEDLTLSWIVIDPTGRRAANLSSWRPVSVQRHWLSGEIQVMYASILAGERKSSEFVQCGIVVTFGGCEGGELQVREVSLQVEDLDGTDLTGKDSLVILQRGLESGKRRKGRREEGKERYEEYVEMKRERKERKLKREERLDMICIAFGVSVFAAFWVREVSLQVEDMDGTDLTGKDSLVILQRGLESGKRRKGRREEGKERYEEYVEMKRERKERKLKREGRLDMICIAFGVSVFAAFWVFVLFSEVQISSK